MAQPTRQWWRHPAAWVATGVIVVAIVVAVVLAVSGRAGVPNAGSSPSLTPDPTPTASSTVLTSETPYCKAFRTIIEPVSDSAGESSGVDWDKLHDRFVDYQKKYQTAAKLAPAELTDDYTQVLSYLQQGITITAKRDVSKLQEFLTALSSLNDAMNAIDTQSRALCR